MIIWLLLIVICMPSEGCYHRKKSATEIWAIVGAKIYPAPFSDPVVNGIILIKDGKILEIGAQENVSLPSNVEVLDASGLTITAGLWNSHVHFMEPHWLRADSLPAEQLNKQIKTMLTKYGFTYAFDLATLDLPNLIDLRSRIANGEVKGPTVLTAGVPFTPPDGSPFYIAPLKLPELSTAEQASEYVKGQLEAGADAIKLWSASPNGRTIVFMPPEMILAATKIAHQYGKPVFTHPTNLEGISIAIKGQVDVLAHVGADDGMDWSASTLRDMIASEISLIPTLKLHKWVLEEEGLSTEDHLLLNTAIQQLRSFNEAGGAVIFGTDVGFMTDYAPEDEYALMSRAGMDFNQILAALTTTPAKKFGRDNQTGRISQGMDADLVLYLEDPAENSKNFMKVKFTIHRGNIIYP